MSAFVQYHNTSSYQFCGTYMSVCSSNILTHKSYQMQLSYSSYYIPVYCDKMLITNTDKFISISPSTTRYLHNDWCCRPCTKNYNKNTVNLHIHREFNGVDYSASLDVSRFWKTVPNHIFYLSLLHEKYCISIIFHSTTWNSMLKLLNERKKYYVNTYA